MDASQKPRSESLVRVGGSRAWWPTPTSRRCCVNPVGGSEGKRSRPANGMVYVPRREIVRGLATAFKNGRLKIARGLPLAGALMGELQAFEVRLTAGGRDTYAARSGEHDDLVMAVGLAVWVAGAGWRGPTAVPKVLQNSLSIQVPARTNLASKVDGEIPAPVGVVRE